jgi:hypothetical protein
MGKLQVHAIVIFVILFGILAWFIALGGLAAATFECTSAEHGDEGAEAKLAASYVPCAKTYQWVSWLLLEVWGGTLCAGQQRGQQLLR